MEHADAGFGLIVKSFEDAGEYIRFHRDYIRTMPDEMTIWMAVRHAPSLPFLPEEVHGRMSVKYSFRIWKELLRGLQRTQPLFHIEICHSL